MDLISLLICFNHFLYQSNGNANATDSVIAAHLYSNAAPIQVHLRTSLTKL